MSLTALQAATIITCHEFGAKFIVTGLVRLYKWKGPNKEEYNNSRMIKDLCGAQMNCSEYSGILAAPLFYLAAIGQSVCPWGVILSVGGQIGYFWSRVLLGYPSYAVAGLATARYAGFFLICHKLVGSAFSSSKEGHHSK